MFKYLLVSKVMWQFSKSIDVKIEELYGVGCLLLLTDKEYLNIHMVCGLCTMVGPFIDF